MKTVAIAWKDAANLQGTSWFSAEQIDNHDLALVITVGYLYLEDGEKVIIVQSDDGEGHYTSPFAIPVACIVHMAVLQDDTVEVQDGVEV